MPLLSDEELPEDDLGIHVSFQQRDPRAAEPAGSSGSAAGGQDGGTKRKHYSGNEMIVAVFVVQFDIRKGESLCLSLSLHPSGAWLP